MTTHAHTSRLLYTFCLPASHLCPPLLLTGYRDRSQPIWVSLSQGRTELYRDILQLEHGNCPFLEE